MPNWCYTEIVFFGDDINVKRLKNDTEKIIAEKCPEENDFGNAWLGHICLKNGFDYKIEKCRGKLSSSEYYEESSESVPAHYKIVQETAWLPMTEMWGKILEKYEGVEMVYFAEEPGDALYINSDIENIFFKDKYIVELDIDDVTLYKKWAYNKRADITDDDFGGTHYFESAKAVIEFFKKLTGRDFKNFADCKTYMERMSLKGSDSVSVNKYKSH